MMRPLLLLSLLATAVVPSAAWADIILGTSLREVTIDTPSGLNFVRYFDGGPTNISLSLNQDASASQTSDIQPLALTGEGSVEVSSVGQVTLVTSLFDVFFDLAEPHSFTLLGNLFAQFEAGSPSASFSLTGPSVNLMFMVSDDFEMFSEMGTLGPGTYHVVALAEVGSGFANADFQFDLQLTPQSQAQPVPEPASIALWGLVAFVACATGWARRSRHA